MHQIGYEEGKKLAETCVCGECGSPLVLCWGGQWGINNHVLRCAKDPEHKGLVEQATYTQAYRRGEEIHPAIRAQIERKMISKDDLGRAMNLLAIRYPRAELDTPSAALFLVDCLRLDLDPLLGEAVPVTFKGKEGKKIITMIITEDGYLSLASRACPDKWQGPPSVEPVTDEMLKEQLCGDKDAWVFKATGRTKDMEPGQTSTTYGWFKPKEQKRAAQYGTPAAELPGNQARVRAIKRWVRENFPEARQKMISMTSEWFSRAEGIQQAQKFIDAEYSILGLPEGGDKTGEQRGKQGGERKPAATILSLKQKPESQKTGAPARPKRDPQTIKTFPELWPALEADFSIPKAQALAELNVSCQEELTELPADCYIRIASVRQ